MGTTSITDAQSPKAMLGFAFHGCLANDRRRYTMTL